MSVVTNLPAMPNRIAIACEVLYSLGKEGGAKDALVKQLSPQKTDEEGGGQGGSTIASAVLSEMESLKLVQGLEGGRLVIDSLVAEKADEATDWKRYLEPILRTRLTDPDIAREHGQAEVPNALAWILVQNPFEPLRKAGAQASLINRQLGDRDDLRTDIGSDARYQNLLYWARYLGFAEWVGLSGTDCIVPDPTRAIVAGFAKIFQDSNELPAGRFAKRIGEVFSVLEGGTVRAALESRMLAPPRKEGHFSPATSVALKRLELRGVLKMQELSDAETWVIDLPNAPQRVSSVALVGER